MRVLGYEITLRKQAPPGSNIVGDRGHWWWPIVREPFTGAWQRNEELRTETILSYYAVYACITLIAGDISKMRIRLVERSADGVWHEIEAPAFSPVLRKPNHFQNRIEFYEQWMLSKLIHGNTYVLKERDQSRIVRRLYVLDPLRVKVLVAPDGSVFYELGSDRLPRLEFQRTVTVPASEIIHDRNAPLFHPLCGVSPLMASGLAAAQGLNILGSSSKFFSQGANPGGILTAPGAIGDDTARRLKDHWEQNYTGTNVGRIAVLGDGLKYEQMSVNAVDAQLIEQLKMSAQTICTAFHVPPYMIGVEPPPSWNNVEALSQQYYSQCLQKYVEKIELGLDDGLGLTAVEGKTYGSEFDTDDLLRMDTATKVKAVGDAIRAGFLAPNEGRKKFDLGPVEGGESPYLQEQNFSLAALAKRDAGDPFAKPEPAPPPPEDDVELTDDGDEGDESDEAGRERAIADLWERALA
jgi:HK97 family phage portal protein